MAASPEELEERVAFLERELERKGVIIDHLQAQSNKHLSEINRNLSQQDSTMHTMAQQISALAEVVKTGFEQVAKSIAGLEKRLDWQDGQFADLNANITEVRNTVAGLVQREGKQE